MIIEGVSYEVKWGNFKRGTSFFIPCIQPKKVRLQLKRVFHRFKMQVVSKISIEDGISGLRIWRV